MCRIHVIGTERKRKRRKTWRDSTRKLRGSWPRRAKSHFILAKVNNGYNNCTVLCNSCCGNKCKSCMVYVACDTNHYCVSFMYCKLNLADVAVLANFLFLSTRVRAFVCTNILMMHSHISSFIRHSSHTWCIHSSPHNRLAKTKGASYVLVYLLFSLPLSL